MEALPIQTMNTEMNRQQRRALLNKRNHNRLQPIKKGTSMKDSSPLNGILLQQSNGLSNLSPEQMTQLLSLKTEMSGQNNSTSTSDDYGQSSDVPPKRGTKGPRTNKYTKLQEQLTGAFASIASAIILSASLANKEVYINDGQIILEHAQPLAERLTEVAKVYPQVYSALQVMMQGSVIGGLIIEIGSIGAAIAKNHNQSK